MPANDIHPVAENDELPPLHIVERRDVDKLIRFHLDDDNEIEWLEVVSKDGDVLEIDPNHVDVSAYREILKTTQIR